MSSKSRQRRMTPRYQPPAGVVPLGFGPFSLRQTYIRTGNYPCPGCDRIMSTREQDEQGLCNDCVKR